MRSTWPIFVTDPGTFQENINVFFEYSKLWKLKLNPNKTEMIVFGVSNTKNFEFKLGGNKKTSVMSLNILALSSQNIARFLKAIRHKITPKSAAAFVQMYFKTIFKYHKIFNFTYI